jgi:spore germination protein
MVRLSPFRGAAWLAVVLAGAAAAGLTLLPRAASGPPAPVIVASLPYWNISSGAVTGTANRRDLTEVSPWMYGLSPGGRITPQYSLAQAPGVNAAITRLRSAGLAIVPSLANITAGRWSYRPVGRILHDPALARQEVAAIAALVAQHNYAGIDIDFENLRAGDRHAFTVFVTRLAAALHAEGKILSVAVFAKTANTGSGQGDRAQDYRAIGRAADQLRVMGYGYHWAASAPGPVAPIGWVRAVLGYAKSQVPAHKIILGVPLFGYDWAAGRGAAVSWLRAFQLARRYHVRPHYAAASQEPWFAYSDARGQRHVVWFENQASSQAKFGAAQGSGIGGVFLWMFGYAQPGTWAVLRRTLPANGSTGGPAVAGGAP